jgi:hypothetical protein
LLLTLVIPDGAALAAEEPAPPLEAVRVALAEGRTRQTEVLGVQFWQSNFREVPAEGGLLIGFDCGVGRFMDIETVYALRPIYLTARGEVTGQDLGLFWGQRQVGQRTFRSKVLRTVAIRANPGYAVGAVTLRTGLNINGLSVTFMRVSGGTLDPNSSYTSQWVGDRTGGSESTVSGAGAPVVGVVGFQDEEHVSALGLVLVRAPAVLPPKDGVAERPADVPRVIPPAAPVRVEPPPKAPETTPAPAQADNKDRTTTQAAGGTGWLPYAIFGFVTLPSFVALLIVLRGKGHGLEGAPGRRSRPVAEDEAIPEVLPADPEPGPETRGQEPDPQPIVWDEDFVAEWMADLSFPPEDQTAEAPDAESTGAARVIG